MSTFCRVQQHKTPSNDKMKKIECYSDNCAVIAKSKEKEGLIREAASYYLKAADILLVICKEEGLDYSTWARLSQKASSYHNRVKILITNHKSSHI